MYNITVNTKHTYRVITDNGKTTVDDLPVQPDIIQTGPNLYHIILHNNSYVTELIELDRQTNSCILRINGRVYTMSVQDRFSELLLKLGIDTSSSQKITELKAPMPGLVLHVAVKEGDTVLKDDNLFTLEAMKMENIIKSPADAVVKSVKVKLGDKVEKNEVLIVFE